MKPLSDVRIVAIDDTPSILTFLRLSFEALGARVHEAMTAAGGLALCEGLHPDVVVLDLGLPDSEGFTILPRIKKTAKTARPLVVVLTVRSEQRYRDRAEKEGADAYITKPFRLEQLVEVIQEKLAA